jgi:hypothetical protein
VPTALKPNLRTARGDGAINLRMVHRADQLAASSFACWHAAHTFCGVAGISSLAPASPGMALAIAFITAAIEAVVAGSAVPVGSHVEGSIGPRTKCRKPDSRAFQRCGGLPVNLKRR